MKKWENMFLTVVGLILLGVLSSVNCDFIKKSEYNKMPNIFEYDHYDDCLFNDPEVSATYCLVRAVIKPDNESVVWRLIEQFSANTKLNLNHMALDRGICLRNNDNSSTVGQLKDPKLSHLIVPKFNIKFPYILTNGTFRNSENYRRKYDKTVAVQINRKLLKRYGLKAYTEIEYCDQTSVNEFPIDRLDIAFLVILATLILLLAASSIYDYSCKESSGLDHYKQDMPSQKSQLLTSFSLLRNWHRLTARSRDPFSRDLRVIQTLRFTTYILTLIGHASILVIPRTGWVIEEKYRQLSTMIVVNGFQIVTIFFAISGAVFTIMYIQKIGESGRKPGLLEIVLITINRYIRLTPVYSLVLLLEASWFIRLQDGPFWRRGVESGLTYCRKNWWANMLYVNNYVTMEEPCMQHSWYLACDFQLSIIGIVLVTLVMRMSKGKAIILSIITAISFVIPGLVIYFNALEGVILFTPEARRFIFWYDKAYHQAYLPTHMNLCMYMTGICMGFIYVKAKNSDNNVFQKLAFKLSWYSIFIVGPCLFLFGQLFYFNDYPKPSVWMSVYFAGARIVWALIMAVGFFGFVFQVNKSITRLMHIRLFEVLGRLTYGAYVGHFFIIKMMFFNVREPSNLGTFDMATKINATLYLSYMLSLALTLLIELPVSALQKILLQRFTTRNTQHIQPEESLDTKTNTFNGYLNSGFKENFRSRDDLA
ncbi:nose resistant to fluoxetine protein 6-like [Uranotaenia lowii]|uniref:nose resistant to fluoxetine protein 6-like n=1 Tax=Uranotaenia lowii TaxID=190385 RepID=UPI0024784A83|nr:nose resistant to fluoxetine protein 6-like [Uranotaenia lowii]